jgi:hypothetical protein
VTGVETNALLEKIVENVEGLVERGPRNTASLEPEVRTMYGTVV